MNGNLPTGPHWPQMSQLHPDGRLQRGWLGLQALTGVAWVGGGDLRVVLVEGADL